jgi:hypothetical protein
MVNTPLTTTHSLNIIDCFNNPGWQSLFVHYQVSGTLFCVSLLGCLNILVLIECSLVNKLENFSGVKEAGYHNG